MPLVAVFAILAAMLYVFYILIVVQIALGSIRFGMGSSGFAWCDGDCVHMQGFMRPWQR